MNYTKSEAKEAAFAQFRGVWAAIATLFTAEDKIDEPGLRRNMRHLTGALNLGLAGGPVRAPLLPLSADERQALVRDLDRVGLKDKAKQAAAAPA